MAGIADEDKRLYYGLQKKGFDPAQAKLEGNSGETVMSDWLKKDSSRKFTSEKVAGRYMDKTAEINEKNAELREKINAGFNPWGQSPDAGAAFQAFERRLVANDKTAQTEYEALQRKRYGYSYTPVDADGQAKGVMKTRVEGAGDAGREVTEYFDPLIKTVGAQKMSEVERYKLQRYDMRFTETEKRIGSGFDSNYNPFGMFEDTRGEQQAFSQEASAFEEKADTDRADTKAGKDKLASEGKAQGVQL